MKKIYISGPMTGYPDLNYPAFNAAEKALRELGFEVENPANNPDPDPVSWEGYMRTAIKQVCDCDTVALLPNWWKSKGAMVEVNLANTLKLEVTTIEELLRSTGVANAN